MRGLYCIACKYWSQPRRGLGGGGDSLAFKAPRWPTNEGKIKQQHSVGRVCYRLTHVNKKLHKKNSVPFLASRESFSLKVYQCFSIFIVCLVPDLAESGCVGGDQPRIQGRAAGKEWSRTRSTTAQLCADGTLGLKRAKRSKRRFTGSLKRKICALSFGPFAKASPVGPDGKFLSDGLSTTV